MGMGSPWAGANMPHSYLAGPAPTVASTWELRDLPLAIVLAAGRLKILMNAGLDGPMALLPDKVHVHIKVKGRSCPEPMEFGRVIVAVGPGQEKTAVPWPKVAGGYAGFEFWEKDDFEVRPWTHGAASTDVVISGAGDGSLQDFLRLMTGLPSAKHIYLTCGLSPSVARDLNTAEAIARSALHWGNNGNYDHLIHRQLDVEHRAAARRVLGSARVRTALDGMLANAPDSMRLVFRCDHFTCMYGLNRFLAHLIIERFLLPKLPPPPPVILMVNAGTIVTAAVGLGHPCGVPAYCFGKPHEVKLAGAPSCWAAGPPPGPPAAVRANVVVIRHGLQEGDVRNLGLVPQLRARQILPYYPPN